MKLQDINWPAVRAFGRVWAPIAERLEMGAAADAGFDAGEWSGEFHANHEQLVYYRTVTYVARRYKLLTCELDRMLEFANHHSYDCWVRSWPMVVKEILPCSK